MNDYTPNSHRFKAEQQEEKKQEERKIEKVVSGSVKTKKKSGFRKFADVILSDDKDKVKSYIMEDIIIPGIKDTLYNIIAGGAGMLLDRGNGRGARTVNTSKVSYRSFSDPRDTVRPGSADTRVRNRFDFDDIVYSSRPEAEAVLDQMQEVIERYGFVTVADMYDMSNLTEPYTSNKYGWTNIRTAEVTRGGGGYVLKLPKASAID